MINSETSEKLPGKEPLWPLVTGSLVLLLIFLPYVLCACGLFWNIGSFGNGALAGIGRLIALVMVVIGLIGLTYCTTAFWLEFLIILAFSKRTLGRVFAITYSMRSWAISAYLLTFAFVQFLSFKLALPIPAHVSFWGTIITSSIVAFLFGLGIVELAHKVQIGKKMFVAIILAEFLSFTSTNYLTNVIIFQNATRSLLWMSDTFNASLRMGQSRTSFAQNMNQHSYRNPKEITPDTMVTAVENTENQLVAAMSSSTPAQCQAMDAQPIRRLQVKSVGARDPFGPIPEVEYKESAYLAMASNWRRTRTGILLNFVIDKDGKPHDVKIVRSSGNDLLDSQAVDSITKVQLPPFPSGMSETKEISEINFSVDANYARNARKLRQQ